MLRGYQQNAINKTVHNFLHRQSWRQLGVLPTGTGKTVVFSNFSNQDAWNSFLAQFPPDQRKTLVIAHREELLEQAKEKYEHWNPTARVEIEQADKWASPDADVIVASIQTLNSRSGRRLGRIDKKQVRLIIIDEAHHSTAISYVRVIQYFGMLPPDDFMPKPRPMGVEESLEFQRNRMEAWDQTGKPPRLLLGVTATPRRSDRVGLEFVFQEIAFEESLLDMIQQGYLSRLRAFRIASKVNLDNVHTKGGDFNEQELAAAVMDVERNRLIVKGWLKHAEGRQTIAFMPDIESSQKLAAEFQAAGRRFEAIWGADPDRARKLKGFSDESIEGLINCNILTEGFDEPNVQCIIHGRPTKSSTLYTQMTGRGTRLCPEKGKMNCIILDVVDVTSRHSLVTAPTLFGLPAQYDAVGGDLLEEVKAVSEMKLKNPMLDITTAKSLEDLEMRAEEIDLFGAFKMPEITEHSTLSWMKDSDGVFQISYMGGDAISTHETMRIKPNEFGGYDVTVENFGREFKPVTPSQTVEEAFHKAEALIKERAPDQVRNLNREEPWRKRPCSPQMTNFIHKLQDKLGMARVDTKTLKAGQGSDLAEYLKAQIRRVGRAA